MKLPEHEKIPLEYCVIEVERFLAVLFNEWRFYEYLLSFAKRSYFLFAGDIWEFIQPTSSAAFRNILWFTSCRAL